MKTLNRKIFFVLFLCCAVCAQGAVWPFNKKDKSYLIAAREAAAQGDYTGAISQLEIFLEKGTVKRREKRAYILLGECYEKTGRPEIALNVYREALVLYPKEKQLYLSLASLYRRSGLTSRALDTYHKALELEADNITALLGLAECYMEEGFFSRSAQYYREYIKHSSNVDAQTLKDYAYVYYRQNMYDAALFYSYLAVEHMPDDPYKWFLLAKINRSKGDKENSYSNLARVIELKKEDEFLLSKILWLTSDGRVKEARAELSGNFKASDKRPLVLFANYYVLNAEGKTEKAEAYLKELGVLEEDSFISRYARSLL